MVADIDGSVGDRRRDHRPVDNLQGAVIGSAVLVSCDDGPARSAEERRRQLSPRRRQKRVRQKGSALCSPSRIADNVAIDSSVSATRAETSDVLANRFSRAVCRTPRVSSTVPDSCFAKDVWKRRNASSMFCRSAHSRFATLRNTALSVPAAILPRSFFARNAFRQDANRYERRSVDDRVLGRGRDPIGFPTELEGMLGQRQPHGDLHEVRRRPGAPVRARR